MTVDEVYKTLKNGGVLRYIRNPGTHEDHYTLNDKVIDFYDRQASELRSFQGVCVELGYKPFDVPSRYWYQDKPCAS